MLAFWQDANLAWVLTGTLLLGISAAVVGGFAVLRQRALIGDVLAHAALPGIMVAFILFESKAPGLVLISALISSLLAYYLISWITRVSKIKNDAAMAIVLSLFFSIGMMALSYIQTLETPNKSGLDRLLFGQAAAITQHDVIWLSWVAIISLCFIAVVFHKLRLMSFDPQYAQTLGLNLKAYELSFALVLVLTIVIGLQIVGVVLMAAALLIPITIARFWSQSLKSLLVIAAMMSVISASISTQISLMIPHMPTGPWIVLILGLLFGLSWLIAPRIQGLRHV
ncbi:MAG: metal ABC transporter permease [Thiomicrospira sp.]|uniref:metal ABC transporter permease n=1 Tax=Thiomicrospira sp. TaxID=935 RepID=UPI0019E1EE7E|nr:metal ABC transporter permease [Thiomicrospira sp.]MBE0493771.1 metal ABC transporter permease [Thiomicrospira sp.]